jgi:hypothetical protein
MEGAARRRATLSDTENLAVGAFGGVLETCIQSTSRSRSRVRVRVGSPPHRPLGRIRFFVVSSISARRARSRLRRTSEPPSTPSTPSLEKRSTIEAFDAAQNAFDFLL